MDKGKIWAPEKRFSYLPGFPRELFIKEAISLYAELLSNKLEVILIPAPSQKFPGHKIRLAQGHNPYWYSGVYYSHNKGKRKLFEKSLWRIANRLDKDFNSKNNQYNYDMTFRSFIQLRFIEGYLSEYGERTPPNNDVRKFFGLKPLTITYEIT